MAPHVLGRIHATAALIALEGGDPSAAAEILARAGEVAEQTGGCTTCDALLHPTAAETYVALGDLNRAEHHARAAGEVAGQWESGSWRAMADMAQATILGARGEAGEAAESFQRAATAFGQIGQRFDAARCLLRAGQACVEAGQSGRARALFQEALSSFEELGAESARRQAERLLAR
jgi:tetratricopeptide (TPR) repeat protein